MANEPKVPLYQQAQSLWIKDTREPQDLPTSNTLNDDDEIKRIAAGMVEAEFGPEGQIGGSYKPSDSSFKIAEEPSVFDQITYGFKEAWLGDEDSMVGTTSTNLKKFLFAEAPEFAAHMGYKKESEMAKDSVSFMEMLDNSLFAKSSPYHAWKQVSSRFASGKEFEEQWAKADTLAEMAASFFKSEETMAQLESNYIKKHYGEDWEQLSPAQRRKRLNDESDAILAEQFPEVHGTKYAKSGWAGLGNVGVVFTDPITYAAPAAKTFRGAAIIGSAYGTIDATTKSLADKGYIDGKQVATGAIAGAIFAPAVKAGAKGMGVVFNKATQKARVRNASKVLDVYEQNMADMVKNGADWNEAVLVSRMMAKTDGPIIDEMYRITGRSFSMESVGGTANRVMTDIEQKASNGFFYRHINGVKDSLTPYIVPITDILQKHTPQVFHALRGTDARMHFRMHSSFVKVAPWLDDFARMEKVDQVQMKKWISSGDHEQFRSAVSLMKNLAKKDPDKFGKMFHNWTRVRSELKRAADDYKGVGHEMDLIKDYFPRIAKNPNKANDAHLGWLSWKVSQESKRLGRPLSETEIGDLFYQASRQTERQLARAPTGGSLRERIVPELNDYLEPHYADPAQALHSYFRTAARDIERANFFNRFSSKKRTFRVDGTDLDGIVDDMVFGRTGKGGERVATDVIDEINTLDDIQRDKIASMLKHRFGSGEQSPNQFIQTYKNLGYALLLGNPISAATQFGDQAFAMFKNGVRHYTKALFSPKVITKNDLGLTDAMEELFANTSKTKRFLDWSLKWSGFTGMDKFGKDMILNSSYRKYLHLASSPKGRRQIVEKWGRYFNDDIEDLLKGLQKQDISNENVRLLLWHELSDVQPIALSEMPEKYLKSPNGRIFYMLKTFTIKQLSFMKRNILDELAKGNVGTGTRKAVGFASVWMLANGTADGLKDMMKGDDPIKNVPDHVVENLIQLSGFSKYAMESGMREGPVNAAMDFLLPPVPFVDELALAGVQGKPERALKAVPYVGNLIYQNLKNKEKQRAQRHSKSLRNNKRTTNRPRRLRDE